MAYDQKIVAEAERLFYEGVSPKKIAADLRRRFPQTAKSIASKTIREWATREDGENATWYDKRSRVQTEASRSREQAAVDALSKVTANFEEITRDLMERFRSTEDMDVTNREYLTQILLQSLTTQARFIQGTALGPGGTPEHLRLFFEVLEGDPELGEVYGRRKPHLLREYQRALEKAGLK